MRGIMIHFLNVYRGDAHGKTNGTKVVIQRKKARPPPKDVEGSAVECSAEQRNAWNRILQHQLCVGNSFCLTGGAGVGKSVTINALMREASKKGKHCISCGSTNISARAIGGVTLHALLKYTLDPKEENTVNACCERCCAAHTRERCIDCLYNSVICTQIKTHHLN